jgi:hypothetical protein
MITDLTKYKRIFAFGCSFTGYIYPTWADIIYKSMSPDVEFYNFAKSGGGNVFIANRITEANRKFKFTETDLVVVMWSTYARIDFYKTDDSGNHGQWKTPGNIYTQDMLSKQAVKELEDLNWFLLRDLSIIDVTTSYLNNLPCDTIKLMSTPFDYEQTHREMKVEPITESIINTYCGLKDEYPMSLFQFMNFKWSSAIKYKHPNHPEMEYFIDYHPTPVDYANYLLKCNVPLSQKAIDYAHESFSKLKTDGIWHSDVIKMFAECDERLSVAYKVLW